MNSKATQTQPKSFIDDERIAIYETLEQARDEFGENFGGFVFRLPRAYVQALLNGKVIAVDIGGREYAGFLTLLEESTSCS